MASFFVFLCFALVLVGSFSVCTARPSAWVGTRSDVPNVQTNVEVQELGMFSVEEHNRRDGTDVVFLRVVEAQRQAVSGIMYYLHIEGEEGGATRLFNASVVVKTWLRSRELVSFEPAA